MQEGVKKLGNKSQASFFILFQIRSALPPAEREIPNIYNYTWKGSRIRRRNKRAKRVKMMDVGSYKWQSENRGRNQILRAKS